MGLKYKRILLKISGEALGRNNSIYCADNMKNIAEQIVKLHKENCQIAIVIGGGNIWRGRRAAEIDMDASNADYMGMIATVMNALALENVIKHAGTDKIKVFSKINIPEVASPYIFKKAKSDLDNNNIVILSGGTGQPFFTTDTAAVIRAIELEADVVLMAKNGVDGVYDSDPNVNTNAKRFSSISLKDLQSKGLQVMDLTASSLALEGKIKLIVFDINEKDNIYKAAHGKAVATVVKGE